MKSVSEQDIETRRMAALHSYAVLDTSPEQSLDELAALAAQICEVPIALVSLVDFERQWFKSRVGLETTETPRSISFCTHAILGREPLIVPDATKDARFVANPLVTGEMGIRFYAGAPLVTPSGEALGTLCVIDRVPRQLAPAQEQALRTLSRQVMVHLELRRQTRELRESEQRLQSFMKYNPALAWMVDDEGVFRYANASFCQMFGKSEEELVGTAIGAHFEPEFAREYLHNNRVVLERQEALESVDPGRRADGSVGQFLTVKFPIQGFDRPMLGGMALDITERERVENALRISEARFGAIFRANPAAIGITILETGLIIDLNEWMAAFFGYAREELIGKKVPDMGFWVDPAQRQKLVDEVGRTGGVREVPSRVRRRDGEVRDVIISLERVNLPGEAAPLLVTMFVDVTERKSAEKKLRDRETILRETERIAKVGGWEFDVQTGKGTWTEGVARIHEFDPAAEIDAATALAFCEEKSRVRMDAALKESIETGRPYDLELEIRTAKGQRRWIRTICHPELEDGKVRKLRGSAQDITERKRSDERFRRLVDSNAQGVAFWGLDGSITNANDAFLRLCGYTREDLEARKIDWIALTPPEYRTHDQRAIEELASLGVATPFEKEYIKKDGTRVPVLIGAANFEDNPTEGVCFVVDLTQLKMLERQFLRVQRLESIGTLAGGIAHDLNNALGPIIESLELLKRRFPDPASLDLLEVIGASAQRGAAMVRQVLAYARGAAGQRVPIQLRALIWEIEKIVRDTFLKNIHVQTAAADDLWPVLGDATQIQQLLLNLCVNARDAMPRGGSLSITAENTAFDAQYSRLDPEAHPGPYVVLKIEDQGIGMAPDVLGRIFDPFFTTKDIGHGTGLGLSTSMSIVKGHGGFVRVESEVGKGSRFMVYLPAQPALCVEEPASSAIVEMPCGQGELILVIDDEAPMRKITQQTLEAFGYEVVLASSGSEAAVVFADHRDKIAAVLTDIAMPTIDGFATIQILRQMRPNLPVIATSGYSTEGYQERLMKMDVKIYLTKPFTADVLLKALKKLLSPGG